MATSQLTSASVTVSARNFTAFGRLTPMISNMRLSSLNSAKLMGLSHRSSISLVVKAAAAVSPKYTSVKPLGDRVLVKTSEAEEKTGGGILLPSSAQTKPDGGEVVAVGSGKKIGQTKVELSVKIGTQVIYSRYGGTEVEYNGAKHILLKEDDIVGVLETDNVKDLKPLNDRVLIQVAEAEEKTSGGLFLTEANKEKPSIGSVVAVGPGTLDEQGNRVPLSVSSGASVLFSKYAGNDLKGSDGTNYIVLRASDIMAILS